MRYYHKSLWPLKHWQLRKRVERFREALEEMPPEIISAFKDFHNILANQFCVENNLTPVEKISDFYADAILAELVDKKLLRFD